MDKYYVFMKDWTKVHSIPEWKPTVGMWAMWLIGVVTGLIWG